MDLNLTDYFYSLAALLFVIALIGMAGTVARRMGFGFTATARKGEKDRLSVVEVKGLDAKRRLVLLRRDDTEHLILLGADSELLIESAIMSPNEVANAHIPATQPSAQTSEKRGNLVLAAIGKAAK